MVDELALSQQDQPQIYHSLHQMAKAAVIRIIFDDDLGLECSKRRFLTQTLLPDIAA